MNYPIIKIPSVITRIKNSSIPIPPEPPLPIKPKTKFPTWLIIAIPVFIIAIVIIVNLVNDNRSLLIPIQKGVTTDGREFVTYTRGWQILLALTPFVFYFIFKKRKNVLDQENAISDKKYLKEMEDYKSAISKYLKEIESLNAPDNLKRYRTQLTKGALNYSSEPQILTRDVNKGKYENHFYNYLVKYFGSKISNNLQLGYFENPYVPDFTYFDKNNNIYIDIEIDEPYVLTTGQPIHYEGIDNNRDDFFNKNNWTVIRFSEQQIAENSEECCIQIQNIIEHITQDVPIKISVKQMPVWSKSEAESFYKHHLRNKY